MFLMEFFELIRNQLLVALLHKFLGSHDIVKNKIVRQMPSGSSSLRSLS